VGQAAPTSAPKHYIKMKTYTAPKCEVIKFSFNESLLTLSDLHNEVGFDDQFSEKRGGWDSSTWTAGDNEEE